MTVTKTHIMSDETGQGIKSALDALVNAQAPTKTSDLTNDSGFQTAAQVESAVTGKGYQTASDVSSAIAAALGNVAQVKFSVVASLPATGEAGTFYLVASGGEGGNAYDEYYDIDGQGTWEKLGPRTLDLSGYAQSSSLSPVATSGAYSDLTETPDLSAYVAGARVESTLTAGTNIPTGAAVKAYVDAAIDAALEVIANGSY